MQNRRGVVPPTTANASLVIRTVGCSMVTTWVHWPAKQRRNLAGREIKLDEKGCFIFSVAASYPLIEFKTSKTSQTKHRPDGVPFSVLLDDVDAKMEQVKKGERPAVPRWALRTRDMADIAISKKATAESDDTLAVAAVAPCFVCLGEAPPPNRCAMCTTTAHESCISEMANESKDDRSSHEGSSFTDNLTARQKTKNVIFFCKKKIEI